MSDRISIITGGSSGLGFEISKKLARRGENVCIVSRTESKLTTSHDKLNDYSGSYVLPVVSDVSKEEDVEEIYNNIASEGFDVHRVFNVAGSGIYGRPEETSRKMIDDVFSGNLIGTILMSSYGMRRMRDRGGHIINVMSTAALKGRAKESVYCAAKWGARGYTEALKAATKGTPVQVTAVYPGGMNTPFWEGDIGMSPDTSEFMSPSDVADKIISVIDIDTTVVKDIQIGRNRDKLQ